MNIKFFQVFCLAALVSCAPQSIAEDNGSSISTKDEVAKEKLSKIYEEVRSLVEKQHEPIKMVYSVLLHSIDKTCMLTHYKNHGLIDKIPNIKGPKLAQADLIVLAGFAKVCSSKTDYFIEFVFEALMSTHPLLEAFIHEHEFKEFSDILLCANNYAVKNKYLDPAVYKINYTLPEGAEANCKKMVEEAEKEIKNIEVTYGRIMSPECVKEIVDDAMDMVFKYFLLVQVEFSGNQMKELREKFVRDVKENDERLIICAENSLKPNSF